MLENNTKQVNRIVAKTLALCTIPVLALLVCYLLGIFGFDRWVTITILVLGLMITISPSILIHFCPDNFMKYYMLIILSLFIGILGTNNSIGIYITFILVPLVSCMYFQPKFTARVLVFSYIIMVVAVFFNSYGKLEVRFKGWTHMEAFRAYLIGFTIEYVIVGFFLYALVKRAKKFMDEQYEAMVKLNAEKIRYRLLVNGSRDIIAEYNIEEDVYSANRSVFSKETDKKETVVIDHFKEYIAKTNKSIAFLLDMILECVASEDAVYKEYDFSYVKNGVSIPLWYQIEGLPLRDDNGKIISVIARLHNITPVRTAQEQFRKRRISDMYISSLDNDKRSVYEMALNESQNFTEADFARFSDGNAFMAEMLNMLKYAKDLNDVLNDVLARMGDFFEVDRICIIESVRAEGVNKLNYQWNRNPDKKLDNFFSSVSENDIKIVADYYDKYGYIEANVNQEATDNFNSLDSRVMRDEMLGCEISIPVLKDGEYTGAILFDKYDTTPYSMVDKLLLSEAVSAISAYVIRLRADEANNAKSLFLSNMSHEIRTPMNAILGMADVALRKDMSSDLRRCISIIKSSSTGLLGIINDILDFSKIEAGKIDLVIDTYSTVSMINDVKTIIEARNVKKRLPLYFHVDEDIPVRLEGDMVRIKQVMVNFATNAVKYTDKGQVDIYIGCSSISQGNIMFTFSVKDTGQGIRQEDMGKLFCEYGQVDAKKNHYKEGTGLGLAISKRLMDLMDGKITVDSTYGVGSTFSFTVPQRVIDSNPIGNFDDVEYTAVTDEKEFLFETVDTNVLLVDDSEINREVAKALLEPLHLNIDEADNGLTAVNMVKDKAYDLILMDSLMPVMGGEEATSIIRGMDGCINQNTPIIAMTADAMTGVKEKLLASGMNEFISKPVVLSKACAKIKKYLPEEKIK